MLTPMFLLTLIISSIMSISTNNWMMMWMGMEINLMSFIPMMNSNPPSLMTSEASLLYFLVQVLSSAMFIFSMMLMELFSSINIFCIKMIPALMISSLMIKVAAAPMHMWIINVSENISWMNNFILMTWQKIAPLTISSYILTLSKPITMGFIIMSALFGTVGALNQTSLRKLMNFSSINHLSWIISAMMINEILWTIYMIIYSFLMLSTILFLNKYNIFNFNQMFLNKQELMLKLNFSILILSLSGMPPFLGFLPKWFIVNMMLMSDLKFLSMFIVILSILNLFYYLKMSFSALIIFYSEFKIINNKEKINFFTLFNMGFSLTGLFLINSMILK